MRVIVVGSGAGGATAARELARAGHRVLVVEAGHEFRPFAGDMDSLARLRATGAFADERLVTALFPPMRVAKDAHGMPLVYGIGTGGTTTLTAGNGLRVDDALADVGLDLSAESNELERLLPLSTDHRARWRPSTQGLFAACERLGMGPKVMPKLIDPSRCRRCGRCVMGCRHGAKWDARRFLDDAVAHGATLLTGARVDRLALQDGRAAGVVVRRRGRRRLLDADLVVLAAGGLGTPKVLERSGVPTDHRLFVDPVLCVAGRQPGARQDAEVPMPFYAELDGVVISPYFDYLSFFFDRRWRARGSDLLPLMIKLADDACGSVSRRRVSKPLSATDRDRLREGVEACRSILTSCGVPSRDIRLGTLNAGHPGGTVPLTPATARSLHDPRLPRNVYVADASLLPRSLGKPPSFTIMALALRVARAAAAYAD